MNDRVCFIDSLRNHIDRPRWSSELRPVNCEFGSGRAVRIIDGCIPGRDVTNRELANLGVSCRGNTFRPDAFIHDRVMIHHVLVYDCCAVVNLSDFGSGQMVVGEVVVVEVPEGNEREMLGTETEIEARTDMHAVEA